MKLTTAATVRYGCNACGKTFHHYPQGVTRKQQCLLASSRARSARVVVFATLLYTLGLSSDAAGKVLELLGAKISKATVWRDAQEVGLALRRRNHHQDWGKVRVIGADETVFKVRGKEVVVGFVTNVETGEPIGVDILIDRSAKGFVKWLRRYAKRLGAQVVVTDDLATYRPAVEELGLEHQVCLTHARRNIARRLREIEGHDAAKEKLRQIMKDLPFDGGQQLLDLALQFREEEPKLYSLALQLSERWERLVVHKRIAGVPATNNSSERAIGPSKMLLCCPSGDVPLGISRCETAARHMAGAIRQKTMRGMKSYRGVLNLAALTREIYGGASELHLEQDIAA